LCNILNKNINRNLIGPLMETISTIGPLCPELFKKHLSIIVNTLIQINLNLSSFNESIANYLLTTWEKLIPNLKEDNYDKIPQIVSSLIELLRKNPEMSISSNPGQPIDVQAFFAEEKNEEENISKDKAELKTSETEEFSIFIQILNEFLTECDEFCTIEHLNILIPIALKLIQYPNIDIQSEISKTLGLIIEIFSKKNENINNIQNNSKNFISTIIAQLLKETDFILITAFVDAIGDIIKSTGLFLSIPEINNLTQKILEIFDKVEKRRIALLKQKKETEEENKKDKKTGDGKIYSDDEEDDDESRDEEIEGLKEQIDEIENVLTSFSEFFGALFDTHKTYTLEIVDKIIKEYLPKYFNDNSSSFEKTLGLLLVDDMAEFLQQEIIGNIWDDIYSILIKYSNYKDDDVRSSACFGLGVFSQFTIKDFSKYCKNILTNLISAINIPIDDNLSKDEKKNKRFAKDNAVSALGKILKYQEKELGEKYGNIFDIWINNMPITQDEDEGKINNKFLLDILMEDETKIFGSENKNFKQIIMILSKVYMSEMSDDIMNSNIEAFVDEIKSNNDYNKLLMELVSKQKGKKLNKIKTLFKL